MNNMNIDANKMNNIKNMVDNGNISDAISQISPEMIQNFSKILSQQNKEQNQDSKQPLNNNFDMGNIDMNTIMKITSAFNKMNNSKENDPRANLLNSLKPYLRDNKKDKLDNYMNLLNVTKIAEIMNNNNFDNKKQGE